MGVLREAAAASSKAQTRGVALALRVLRERCADDWLIALWQAAGSDHDLGKSQSLHAAYNGIVRQVRLHGSPAQARKR